MNKKNIAKLTMVAAALLLIPRRSSRQESITTNVTPTIAPTKEKPVNQKKD